MVALKKTWRQGVVALLAGAGLMAPNMAHAVCDACVTAAVATSTTAITTAITAATTQIVLQLKAMAAERKGDANKQNAVNKALTQTQLDYQGAVEVAQASADVRDALQPAPNACQTMRSGTAIPEATNTARQVVNTLGRHNADRNGGRDPTNGQPLPPAKAATQIYQTHTSQFCGPEDLAQGRCTTLSPVANGDVRADVLLTPPNGSKSYTPLEAEAAEAFKKNVTNPTPAPNLPKQMANTPQGKAYYVQQMVANARMSVAQHSLDQIIAEHTKQPGLGAQMQMPQADASVLDVIQYEVDRRFSNSGWYIAMATATTDALLREVANILAFNVWVDYRRYMQMERVETLLATQLAMEVEQDAAVRLAAQRNMAAKGSN